MKYKIKKKFKDRYTKVLYEVGALVEFDDARAEEIVKSLGSGFIEKNETPKTPKTPKAPKAPKPAETGRPNEEGKPVEEDNLSETGESGGDH
jgi:hypothetical protein